MNCHRRSGYGSSEGDIIAPAITGQMLFEERQETYKELSHARSDGIGVRPAYTHETLRRAIRHGMSANGLQLDAFMPRFELPDKEIDALIAYLQTLGSKETQGVTDEYIEFATVVTPGVSETRKNAMSSVLNTYISDINAGTRKEGRRENNSPWHKSWHYKSYRKWRLHIWALTGEPETWHQQLASHYKQQPVFAIANGIGNNTWKPIDEFCESYELPCLFPTTDLPEINDSNFYSIYFSKGMTLEAEIIAHDILNKATSNTINVHQFINSSDPLSTEAAKALESILTKNNINSTSHQIHKRNQADTQTQLQALKPSASNYLVFWGDYSDVVKHKDIINNAAHLNQIYLSSTLLGHNINDNFPLHNKEIHLIHRRLLPEKQRQKLLRFTAWARIKKITVTDTEAMANAFFAVNLLTDATKHLRNHTSQELLIERIEHMVDNTLFHSVYPSLSLAPDQRYASKGGYLLTYQPFNKAHITPTTQWVVP